MIKFKLFGPFFLWVGKCGFWCNKNDRDEFSMTPFSVDVSGWITWGTAGELNALLKSSGITFRPPSKLRWWEGDVASDAFMIYICFIVIRLKNICPLDLLIENPLSKAMIFTGKPLKIMILGIPGYIYIYTFEVQVLQFYIGGIFFTEKFIWRYTGVIGYRWDRMACEWRLFLQPEAALLPITISNIGVPARMFVCFQEGTMLNNQRSSRKASKILQGEHQSSSPSLSTKKLKDP